MPSGLELPAPPMKIERRNRKSDPDDQQSQCGHTRIIAGNHLDAGSSAKVGERQEEEAHRQHDCGRASERESPFSERLDPPFKRGRLAGRAAEIMDVASPERAVHRPGREGRRVPRRSSSRAPTGPARSPIGVRVESCIVGCANIVAHEPVPFAVNENEGIMGYSWRRVKTHGMREETAEAIPGPSLKWRSAVDRKGKAETCRLA